MENNKIVIAAIVILVLFGNKILPPALFRILSNPIVRFSLIYWFIYSRVKNYYHAMWITLFVAACFAIVNWLEKPRQISKSDNKEKQ